MSSVWSHRPYQSSWSEKASRQTRARRDLKKLEDAFRGKYVQCMLILTAPIWWLFTWMEYHYGWKLTRARHYLISESTFQQMWPNRTWEDSLDKFARPGFCCVVWLPTTLRWSNSTKARKESIYEAFNLAGCLWVLASYKSCYKVIAYICSAKIVLHRQHSSSDKHWS